MSAPQYDRMSKKDLIDRLIEAEKQLRRLGKGNKPDRIPAVPRRAGKGPGEAVRPEPAAPQENKRHVLPGFPAGADVNSASESDCTVLDRDGRIRRLYRVVKDIQDDAGNPVFSEGALYEIGPKPGSASGDGQPDMPGESDKTELICRFRPNGSLTYVNEAYCRYFGCERDDLQGRNVLLSISEADREKVYTRLKELRPERPVDTLEYRVENVFGDVLWNQWTYRALFDDSGNVLEYQSVGRDITFRKYTQEVLEKRAAILEAVTYAAEGFLKSANWRDRIERVLERFGAAMNASHVFLCENQVGEGGGITVLRSYDWLSPESGGDGNRQKFLRDSELAVRFSEWVYAKSEGRPIYGTIGSFPEQVVGELKLDKQLSIAVIPILSEDRWWGFIGFADYTGDIQWSEDEIAPLGAASEILGAAIEREAKDRALREAHATLREQERFLAGVFDAIQDGIMVAAPDMTILRVNKTLEKRFPDADTLPGRKCYEAYYGLEQPCEGCACQKTIQTGEPAVWSRCIEGADGEVKKWVDVFSYPWVDPVTGQLKGVIEYSRDITAKKKAEEELSNTRIMLEQAFEQSPYPMALVSMPDAVVRIANPAMREFLEITDEPTPVGQSLFEMKMSWKDCDPQGNPVPLEELPLPCALRGKKTVNREVMAVTKNGTVRHELVSGVPICNDRGDILAGYLVCTDITERKRAEEARVQSEKRLRRFIDSSRDVIFLKDENFRYLVANKACLSLGEAGVTDVLGKTDFDLFPDEQARRFREEDEAALACNDEAVKDDLVFKDRFIEVTKFPVDLGSGRVGVGGIVRDVTEQRQAADKIRRSEKLLRIFVDSSQDYIFLKDEKGRNILLNRSVRKFTGRTEEELLGKTDAELLPPAVAERSRQSDRKVLEAGNALSFHEQAGGRSFEVMKFPVYFSEGRIGVGGIIRDITERIKAQEALRASEERYRELADTIPVGVYEADMQGNVVYANRTAQEMFGYGADEITPPAGVHFLGIIAPEHHASAIDLSRRVREDRAAFSREYTFVRKDGSRFTGLITSRPMIRDGQVAGSRGVCTDLSALKDAQRALRENEAMLQSILQAAPIGISFGVRRTLKWVNERYRQMTGYGREQLEGNSTRVLYDSDEEFLRVGADFFRGIDRGGIGTTGTRWTRKDGSQVDVLLNMSAIFPEDPERGVVVTALDVTEQKRAEEALRASELRYRELADHLPVGVYEADFDGMFTYSNSMAMKLFGYGEENVRAGMHFLQVIAPEEHEIALKRAQGVRQGNAVTYVEYTFLRKDGTRFPGLLMARPLIRDGRIVGSTGVVTDITELKRTQEALRKNEVLLGSILRTAPVGVGMVQDRILGWVNEGMTVLTGCDGHALRGKSTRILYPDDEEFERAGRTLYDEIAARGKGAVETRWKRGDGSVVDVQVNAAPINPADFSAGVVFTALDITAQKKAARILLFAKKDLEKQVAEQTRELDVANMLLRIELEEHHKTEEALVKSEEIYRAIVEDQTEIICRFRPDGTISFVNEAFCRYFGKGREEVIGSRYLPSIPREDRKRLWTAYGELTPDRPVFHIEFRIETPDGTIRWLNWTNRALFDGSGALVEHQGVCRDITERIRSEQQIRESRNTLRSVFDGISDPLAMVREDMTVIMLNRAALQFFGATLYRELIGTSCLESFRGRYGVEETNLVQAAIAEQEPARYELAARGDAARYEEVFVYPVQAGGEGRCMAIIRVTDRTRQRLMERELIQSEKLASLGLLISGIVHEINNPNNFISFNMPILRDYIQDILPVLDEYAVRKPDYEVQGMPYADFRGDVLKLIENIEHGSTRINATVAKLKEFSRKKDEKGARPILPTAIVEKAVSICHTQIRKTVKTFEVQVQQDMPEMVTDPDAVEQTLINLLINAAQAADKPDSRILLTVRQGTSGEGLVLEVEDNGCGMDGKTASRIFDPFYTTKEEGLGTGLGLYISKNLIEDARGSITVESEIGRGTTFRVVLPDLDNSDHRKQASEKKGVDS
jgi:PAS domain S-box-containing protein